MNVGWASTDTPAPATGAVPDMSSRARCAGAVANSAALAWPTSQIPFTTSTAPTYSKTMPSSMRSSLTLTCAPAPQCAITQGGAGSCPWGMGRPLLRATTPGSCALFSSVSSARRSGAETSAKPGGEYTRRASSPQLGHCAGADASAIGRTTSNAPHASHLNA
jgi:hypothetical protein